MVNNITRVGGTSGRDVSVNKEETTDPTVEKREVSESRPEVKVAKSEGSKSSVTVRVISNAPFSVGGKEKLLAVTTEKPLRGFLVDADKLEFNSKAEQQINPDDHIEAYNFKNELEKMYPDIETVRQNALLSFYRAGAYDKDSVKERSVSRNLLQHAYPYKLNQE